MKLICFCVRDAAADMYGTPQFLPSAGQALRSFTDEVNRVADDNPLFKHSVDFELYKLGIFDTDSGLFDCGRPELLLRGCDAKVK